MKSLRYEILIEHEADPKAGYSVSCPALPGCLSNGRTLAQARKNMREAMALHVETLLAHGEPVPPPRKAIRLDELTLLVPA